MSIYLNFFLILVKILTFFILLFLFFQSMYIVVVGGDVHSFYLMSYILLSLSIVKFFNYSCNRNVYIVVLASFSSFYFILAQEYFLSLISFVYSILLFKVNKLLVTKKILFLILICSLVIHQNNYIQDIKNKYNQEDSGETWQKYGAL